MTVEAAKTVKIPLQIAYVLCEISKTVFKIFLAKLLKKLCAQLANFTFFDQGSKKVQTHTHTEILKILKSEGINYIHLYKDSPFRTLYKNTNNLPKQIISSKVLLFL